MEKRTYHEAEWLFKGLSSFHVNSMYEEFPEIKERLIHHFSHIRRDSLSIRFLNYIMMDYMFKNEFDKGESGPKIFNELRFFIIGKFGYSFEDFFEYLYQAEGSESEKLIRELIPFSMKKAI